MAQKTDEGRLATILRSGLMDPRSMAVVIFASMWLVAVVAVQRVYGLGVPSPHSKTLTLGGFLTGSGRALGISRLSFDQMAALYMSLLIVIFVSYIWALILLARNGKSLTSAFIIGASVAFCLWVLFIPPLLAKDLFNYASYGQTIALHGKNPYLLAPAGFPGAPVLKYISWKDAVSVYGPLFNYLAGATALIARDGAVSSIVAFKLMPFAFFVGSLFVADSLARRMHLERRAFLLAAVAWNPLVIIHLVGGGHNDTIMLFFILLGFLLYRQNRPVLAISSAVLAVLVKTTAVFVLVPMLVLFLRQNSRWTLRKYAQGLVVVVAIPLAFYLPMWPGLAGFRKIISVGTDFNSVSVPSLVSRNLESALRAIGVRHTLAGTLGINGTRAIFMLAFLVVFALCAYRVRDIQSLIKYSGVILFAFILSTSWLMPWYAGSVAVIMVLSGSYVLAGTGIGLTFVMSLYGHGLNTLPSGTFPLALLLMSLAVGAVVLLRRMPARQFGSPAAAGP
jgi:alpha-1,6-mannosyltransferase